MAANDIQAQLRSLAIPKDQRPTHGSATRRTRRTGLTLSLVLLAGLGIAGYVFRDSLAAAVAGFRSESADEAPIPFVQVAMSDPSAPQSVLTATGKIVSDHRVVVATKVSGQIVELFFEQGDRVEQGQLLARVEDVLYRARRDEAAARLQRSLANVEFQRINFKRVSGLMESASAPDIELADARRWLSDAEAAVAADQAALASAQKFLGDTQVVAPIAGVVLTRNVEVGDFVAAEGGLGAQANAAFATIADMSKLRVEVDISELDIIRIHKDMPATIVPDAYKDRKYNGHVMWLDPGANYSKATVQVKVRIDAPDEFLRVEGSAQVSFLTNLSDQTESARPAIWIPLAAVQMDPAGNSGAVFVKSENRLHKTLIQTGRKLDNRIEVLQGLSPGQSIAADGLDKLTDNQRVPD